MEIINITVQQSQTLVGFFGNNADWHYLSMNYSLNNIAERIEKNSERIGDLFVEFILTVNFKNEGIKTKQKNKVKVLLDEKNIKLTHKILRLLAENAIWSIIDFKRDQLQERIIRNPFGAGQQFTNFLVRIMTDEELGLV